MIINTLHVNTLFLTWQSNTERNQRYLVGALKRTKDNNFEFLYLTGTSDYEAALAQGFKGYPAFRLDDEVFSNDVIATFAKRLPPRSRRDFKNYLINHHLPENFEGDDFDLISHTGIQLPSDGFNLIPNLSEADIPFDYVMEVAGTRHYMSSSEVESIAIGAKVDIRCEDDNEYDSNAIALSIDGQLIGYVNKSICPAFRELLQREVTCVVVKKSGTTIRPLIYVTLSVR